ncbi:hypothetical protein JVX91_14525 [Pseudomonas sp. PDNC002]|uniref:hypothetical protein n=1 Tax=Pseudomonas sp. PDNC002 TaxID=2811422 RepID=UPI001964812D|nr:hypothetical protein [Pseudomonas sp. PDNC002]QRY82257.1 hypothetical protein JVX91_14525 [Pseudomonas sp. PDNC002]
MDFWGSDEKDEKPRLVRGFLFSTKKENKLDRILEEFIKTLNAGNIWAAFIFLAIVYLLKKEPFKIYTHISEKKDKDISLTKDLLASPEISKETKEALRELIAEYAFKKIYGITANKERREKLLSFYNKHQENIGWHDLRRAAPYTKIENGGLKFKISAWDIIGRIIISTISLLIGSYAAIVAAIAFYAFASKEMNPLTFFALSTLSVVLLFGALAFSSINWPYHSAKKLKHLSEGKSAVNCRSR